MQLQLIFNKKTIQLADLLTQPLEHMARSLLSGIKPVMIRRDTQEQANGGLPTTSRHFVQRCSSLYGISTQITKKVHKYRMSIPFLEEITNRAHSPSLNWDAKAGWTTKPKASTITLSQQVASGSLNFTNEYNIYQLQVSEVVQKRWKCTADNFQQEWNGFTLHTCTCTHAIHIPIRLEAVRPCLCKSCIVRFYV